jgi:hypothetical protein
VYLDDIAQELSVMNVAAGGTAFTPVEFAAAVTTATAAAMDDQGRTAGYALRLARELGIRRAAPVDLAVPPGAEPIVLDSLSGFLVAADVSLPRILGADPPPVAAAAQVASVGNMTRPMTAADPCTKFRRQVGSNWYAGVTRIPGSTAENASFSRSLQARLIGGTVVFSKQHEPTWHHLHKGETPQDKRYVAALQVRVQIPSTINCGPIRFNSGGQPVGGGQIVGAAVTWTHPGLEHHGTLNCQAGCRETDSRGIASLFVTPHEEPPPGGIGPELSETIPVMAEVDLFQALGPDLLAVLSLPADMRVLARRVMPSDIKWHRAFEFRLAIDSQLYVTKASGFGYTNHVGTGTLSGVLEVGTAINAEGFAVDPPIVGDLLTVSDAGTGTKCAPGVGGSKGSVMVLSSHGGIDFQVIEMVVYPWDKVSVYLDVGPADDFNDDTYRYIICDPRTNLIASNTTAKFTNLWEHYIFWGYPRGMAFSGSSRVVGGPPGNDPHTWNAVATEDDWAGDSDFLVAKWEGPEDCGGYCDPAKSWINMTILADPLPDP